MTSGSATSARATIEEVDRVVRGGNYGWRCFEGTQDVRAAAFGAACGTPANPLPPVAQYTHTLGQAVTGGYVYRGTAIPGLVGRYVFADFVTGRIWDIPNDTQPTMTMTGGLDSGLNISSFAEDHDGELYVVNMRGDLHRITGSGGGGAGVATQLSATGCVNASNATLPASGLIPYAPNAPFWSDGAAKERWIGLPDGQNITVGADGDWDFPNGTVLMKNFRLDNRLIETRLFMRHPDGVWAGYSYEWNAQGTDATLVRGGKQVTIGGQTWIYPSEGAVPAVSHRGSGPLARPGDTTTRVQHHVSADRPRCAPARDAQRDQHADTADRRSGGRDPVSQSDRNGGHARRASARVSAHQLLAVPSPGRPDDVQHGSALRDRTRGYQRLRRRARTRRPRHHRRAAHRAGRRGTLGAARAHEPRATHTACRPSAAQVDAEGAALLTNWINSLANCN